MNITDILIFAGFALFIRLVLANRGRQTALFIASVLGVYWLQPATPLRYFDFWFPTLTLALILLVWAVVSKKDDWKSKPNIISLGVMISIVIFISLTRYWFYEGLITRTRPPQIQQVVIFILVLGLLFLLLGAWKKRFWVPAGLITILLIFICLKTPGIAAFVSAGIRTLMSQSTTQASALDLRWLGYSYVAFRLIHVLRDCQKGRCRVSSLQQFVIYTAFFPAFVAGPIDRLERFAGDLEKPVDRSVGDFVEGGKRLVIGLLKKYVIADTLSLFALNADSAAQLSANGWGWVLLFSYSFQILLDFSGYTDIAIGIARFVGIRLPENFQRPYLQQNLTTFWNNWHMTLTQWFRAYYFNPVTRSLRRSPKLTQASILLFTQLSTMVLIGLWHGITWNFVIWGAWHGLGLFAQNRWSDWVRPRIAARNPGKAAQGALRMVNVALTFTFVSLGWIWFALPEPELSWQFLVKLF